MTIGRECSAPRWGGVAQGSNSESPTKPQELSDCDFRHVQDHAALSVNDSGTPERIDTRLTQPTPEMFASRSLLRVAAVQLPRLDPEDRAALLPFVKRDMEACRG